MNVIKTTWIALCLVVTTSQAQQQQNKCDYNVDQALTYLKAESTKSNYQKAIKSLEPCVKETNDPLAQFLLGKVYAELSNEKKAFKLIKLAAKQGLAEAQAELGIYYKYGFGCNQNFRKAVKWFKKANKSGSNLATYALGYIYYKGFGDVQQNYRKAVKWFKKSNYPMAKYWLGVCYKNGYGVRKNLNKAAALLGTEFTSKIDNNTENLKHYAEVLKAPSDGNASLFANENTLSGIWKGSLLFNDWYGTRIEHVIPIEIIFNKNQNTELLTVTWKLNHQELNKEFSQIENTLYYDNMVLNLPYYPSKKELPKELNHKINSIDFSLKNFKENNYLIGTIQSTIPEWKEKSMPFKIILEKKTTFANSNEEVSKEALEAITGETDKFIKFYPNPFIEDIIISYALDSKSNTEVKLSNLDGSNAKTIKTSSIQPSGTYHYYLDGSDIKPGMYLVSIKVGSEIKTRIVVKK